MKAIYFILVILVPGVNSVYWYKKIVFFIWMYSWIKVAHIY